MKDNRKPDPPTKFDWDAGGDRPIPGTEDWHLVTEAGDGGGYDWTTWRAYYSPSARRYFWHGDSGCSCNTWADELHTSSDFGNGSRADALNALREFAKDYSYSISGAEALDASTEIRTFKEPKP